MRPSSMPTHSMGRNQRSRCAGLTIGSMERTASVQSSNISGTLTCPQRVDEKNISDFRRDHATSPCLSTAIGNRQLPRDERSPSIFLLARFGSVVANPRVRVTRGGGVLYQNGSNTDKRAAAVGSQARENRSVNFFTFVTEETHRESPHLVMRA